MGVWGQSLQLASAHLFPSACFPDARVVGGEGPTSNRTAVIHSVHPVRKPVFHPPVFAPQPHPMKLHLATWGR